MIFNYIFIRFLSPRSSLICFSLACPCCSMNTLDQVSVSSLSRGLNTLAASSRMMFLGNSQHHSHHYYTSYYLMASGVSTEVSVLHLRMSSRNLP